MRKDIAAIGVLVLLVGFGAYVYQGTITEFGITATPPDYHPYRDLGTALIVVAILVIVLGVALKKEKRSL